MQSIQDNLAEHLSEGQKRKLTFGIATLGDPRVCKLMHGEKGAFNKWELCSSIDGGRALSVACQARTCWDCLYHETPPFYLFVVFYLFSMLLCGKS